ncbi:MAG TPA: hypothetical protein VFG86_19420, partial [Chloroflexota bacterium]|nr:hypothetical protein [Chloroflexota bacterium]
LHDPPLLLLDEPDAGLDLGAFSALEALITRGGHALVLTTHNIVSGLRFCSRVAVLSRGRIVHTRASVGAGDAPLLGDLLQQLATA